MSGKVIANLDINLRGNISGFQGKMKEAKDEVVSLKDTVSTNSSSITSMLGGGLGKAAGLAVTGIAAIGAAAAAAAASLVALSYAQFGTIDASLKVSQRLGIQLEKLQGLQYAANLAGASNETLEKGLQTLGRNSAMAANGSSSLQEAFGRLGINAMEFAKLSPDVQFNQLAEAMKGVEDQSQKVLLAQQLMGRGGVQLMNTLDLGAEGLASMQAEAERLGLTLSADSAAGVEKANDAMERMWKSIQGIGIQFAPILADIITPVSDMLTEGIVIVRQFFEEWKPHLTMLGSIFTTTFTVIIEILGQVFSFFGTVIQGIASWLGFGDTSFADFKTGCLDALIAIEFGLKNWQKMLELAVAIAMLRIVSFANDFVHFFVSVLPQAIWSYVKLTGEAFVVMWENIKNGWDNLMKWFRGEETNFEWKGMTDSINKELEAIAKSFERADSPFEKGMKQHIENLSADLGNDWEKFYQQRMDELNGVGEEVQQAVKESMDIPELEVDANVKQSGGKLGDSFAEQGSQLAADIIRKSMGIDDKAIDKQQLQEAKNQNQKLDKMIRIMEAQENQLLAADL